MSKLKTLKDLENGFKVVGIRELKAEAAKWVKNLKARKFTNIMYDSQIGWIEHFFNLTEDNLK